MKNARILYFAATAMLVLQQPAAAFTLPRSSTPSRNGQPRTPSYFPNFSKSPSSSSLSSLRLSLSSMLHKDPFYCLSAVLLLSTFGISLERRTVVGKALSAPLATMALALFVANVGIVPFEAPIYSVINKYIVPLAVPMLLFDSDLRRVMRDTGSLLVAFAVGAFATVAATIIAFPLVPMLSLGDNNWRVACALAARHIGGAINFVAVAETLNIAGSVVSAAIAADNMVVAIYFAILFALAKETTPFLNESIKNVKVESDFEYSIVDDDPEESTNSPRESSQMDLPSVAIALSVSASLVTVGGILTKLVLPKGTSSLPLTSALTVAAATVFPKFFSRIRTAGTALGIVFIQMFFAVSGAAGSIRLVFQQAPALFAFSAAQVAVHFGILMGVGRGLFRLEANELYLASNANVGGPTTAAAMAQAKHWKRLVLPALLTGILGYAIATPIALLLGPILCRLPIFGRF